MGKKMGELRNEFWQMFCETPLNKLLLLSKKSLHNIFKQENYMIKILVYQSFGG